MLAKFSFRGKKPPPPPTTPPYNHHHHQQHQQQQSQTLSYPQSAPTSPQKKSPSRQHSYQLPPPQTDYRQQQQQQQQAAPASPSLLRAFRAVASPQLPQRRQQQQQQQQQFRVFELPDTAPQRQTPVWIHDAPLSFADCLEQQQQQQQQHLQLQLVPPPPPPPPPHHQRQLKHQTSMTSTSSKAAPSSIKGGGVGVGGNGASTMSVATQAAEPAGAGQTRRKRPVIQPQLHASVCSNSSINGGASSEYYSEHASTAQTAAATAATAEEVRLQLKKSQEAGKLLSGRFDDAIKRLELLEKECQGIKQSYQDGDSHRSQLNGRLDRLEQVGCAQRLSSLERENGLLRQELLQAGRFTDELANQMIQNTLIQKNLTEECTYLRERLSEVERVNQQLTTALVSMLTQTIDPQYLHQRSTEQQTPGLPAGSKTSTAANRLNAVLQNAVTRLTGDSCTHSQCPPVMCCPPDCTIAATAAAVASSCDGAADKAYQLAGEEVCRPGCRGGSNYYTLEFTGCSTIGNNTANRPERQQRSSRPNSEVRNRREQSVLNLTATVGSAICAGATLVAVDLETFLRAREKLDRYRARLNRQAVCSDSELTTDRFLILSDIDEIPISVNKDCETTTAAGPPTSTNGSPSELTISSDQELVTEPKRPHQQQQQQSRQQRQPPPVQIQRRRIVQREKTPGTGDDNSSTLLSTASDRSSSDMTPPRSPPPPPPLPPHAAAYQQRQLIVSDGGSRSANNSPVKSNSILLPYPTKQHTAGRHTEQLCSPSHPTAPTTFDAAAASGLYPPASDDLYIDDDFEVQQPVFGGVEFEETGDEDGDDDDDEDLLREIQQYQLPSSSFA